MMNQNTSCVFIVLIAVALVFPFARAEALIPIKNINLIDSKLDQPPLKKQPKNTGEFCTKFTDTANTLAGNIGKQQTKALGFLAERKDVSKEGRDIRDADLKKARDKADQKRNDWYKKLDDKADTDAKKNAVFQFKQTVDSAVDARHTAVDVAIESFRSGVDDAIVSRDSSMQNTNHAFQTTVDTAVAAVKTNCGNGATSVLIRFIFTTSLGKARETLKDDRKNTDKVGAQVKALASARQEAVKEAVTAFQATMKTAVADLEKAFGE